LNGAQRDAEKSKRRGRARERTRTPAGTLGGKRSETLEQDKSFRIEIDREREERRKKDFLSEAGKEVRIGELFIG
jgi:hypothetical protein